MARPYYSKIAKQWHNVTGHKGGPFKKYILNDYLINHIERIEEKSILELGAGNGYFIPLMLEHFSGQKPLKIVITDLSGALLKIAEQEFKVQEAKYIQLNIRTPFPFEDKSFDIIFATMVFNEINDSGLKVGLTECYRVLKKNGQMIASITHPEFIDRLSKNGKLSRLGPEFWTMPGKGPLKIPVVIRSEKKYDKLLKKSGFIYSKESLYPTDKVINERPGLRHSRNLPLALVFNCYKSDEYS